MAANLRPTITGVGPLIGLISRGTGLSAGVAGIVTTLPLIAFGLLSPFAPRAARRFGLERTLYAGLIILLGGTLLRSSGTAWALLVGMFLVGSGVAIGNVLLPSLVKRDFPTRIGLMTGIYTTVMNIFAGLASGISVPLSHIVGFGWRGSLTAWAILTLVALLLWLPHLRQHHIPESSTVGRMWRSPIAWQVTLFMGLQSFLFYVNVSWLPTLLHDRGMSLTLSGWLVSLMQIVSLPGTFLMPIWAGRQRRQQNLVIVIALLFFVGYLGLLVTHGNLVSILWVIFIGFGAGASISLALAFFSLRTHNHHQAGQISGMAQSVGYLLAAVGPLTVGLLHSASASWTVPLIMLLVVVVLMALSGLGAGRDVYIEGDENAERSSNRSRGTPH